MIHQHSCLEVICYYRDGNTTFKTQGHGLLSAPNLLQFISGVFD